jgi:signal transduction histidine kinase
VLLQRRLAALNAVAAATSGADSHRTAFIDALHALAQDRDDVSYAVGWLIDPTSSRTQLVEAIGVEPGGPMARQTIPLMGPDMSWPLGAALAGGDAIWLDQLALRFRGQLVGEPPAEPSRAIVAPLKGGGRSHPSGVMVLGISDRLPLDDTYRGFLALACRDTEAAIARAGIREREREQLEQLAQLDRAKTEFFSNVSHEFRTPLTLMLAPLDALSDSAQELPPGAGAQLDVARRNARRLLGLVDGLLAFPSSRLDGCVFSGNRSTWRLSPRRSL